MFLFLIEFYLTLMMASVFKSAENLQIHDVISFHGVDKERFGNNGVYLGKTKEGKMIYGVTMTRGEEPEDFRIQPAATAAEIHPVTSKNIHFNKAGNLTNAHRENSIIDRAVAVHIPVHLLLVGDNIHTDSGISVVTCILDHKTSFTITTVGLLSTTEYVTSIPIWAVFSLARVAYNGKTLKFRDGASIAKNLVPTLPGGGFYKSSKAKLPIKRPSSEI